MGGLCCKTSAIKDSEESPRERMASAAAIGRPIAPRKISVVSSSRRDELPATRGDVVMREKPHRSGQIKVSAQDLEWRERQSLGFQQDSERKRERKVIGYHQSPVVAIPKALEGEQVAAGWPPWLASVAGEAIRGWVPRRADSFEKLDKVCFL